MDCGGRFVRGDGSMALISVGLFGESREQQRLQCVIGYRLRKLEVGRRLR